ncbi:class I SAM-dependent methyltransferase [Magnetococcus sp. PR-3]|uniref:class I SAM-dependent methyltransferase n=1 Tax=Magnetococcus sp. PR-3 TaxID=3120355 RepID=UPI002FCE626C
MTLTPTAASEALQHELIEMAKAHQGWLSFHQFMSHALYHPIHGYYMRKYARLGKEGDFTTAPEMTSLFGELLTLQFIEVWQRMGSPGFFSMMEVGAGSGKLAVDVLKTAEKFPPFYEALSLIILEKSPDFRCVQAKTLEQGKVNLSKVRWVQDIESWEQEGAFHGVVYGNEILDAFPVQWIEQTEEGLKEVAAHWDGTQWSERLIEPTDRAWADYFTSRDIELDVGMRTEFCLDAQAWVQKVSNNLAQGALLFIDYGYVAKDYYQSGLPHGTLMAHHRHERIMDPWLVPGDMDLTAHVDFSAMSTVGREQGMDLLGFTTQGWFLMGLGILQRLEQVIKADTNSERVTQLRHTVSRLIMPDAMGERFKVLAMGRGLGEDPLAGFSMKDQSHRL